MTTTAVPNSQELARRSAELEREYRELAAKEWPTASEIERFKQVRRELDKIAGDYLRAHDGKRHRGS